MRILVIIFLHLIHIESITFGQTYINTETVIRLLNDSSSASNRFDGFSEASLIDSAEVNNELVKLLDSKQDAELILDILVLTSWEHALILLAKRFPEAGVPKRPRIFDRSDAEIFKKWWSENQTRIEYQNNTHRVIPDSQPQKIIPAPEPQSTVTSKDNWNSPLGSQQIAPTPAITNQPAQKQISKDEAKSIQYEKFHWPVAVVVGMASLALLWLLLKNRRSTG